MEISVKNLTDLQKIAFSKFKEKIEDLDTTEYSETNLLKFLRAKNFDVRGAVRIFRENYYNRIVFEIGRLTETYKKPEVAEKYETIGTLGFAKDGSFIRYTAAGKLDFYGMIMSMSCPDMCLYFCYLMESDIKELREENLRFKEELGDLDLSEYSDIKLLKFLRAKGFDVKSAKKNLRENYYSRIIYEVDTLMTTYVKPEVAQKYEALGFIGFAKDGSPVTYGQLAKLDYYGFVMAMSYIDLCYYFVHVFESDLKKLKEENERTGRHVNDITYIVDLEDFSIMDFLSKGVLEFALDYISLLQDTFPEIWRRILIINVPSIFDKIFMTLKPVLRATIVDRFRVAGKDLTKELLLEYVDENVLPVFLGGKRVDLNGDTLCREFIKFGGLVPELLYGRNQELFLESTQPGVLTCSIGPRSCFNYSMAIQDQNGKRVQIGMRSENGSVTITILYRKFEESEDIDDPDFPAEEEIMDVTNRNCRFKISTLAIRAQSQRCPVNNTIFLPWPGVYVISYSNIGSWFTSRKLFMRHTLLPA